MSGNGPTNGWKSLQWTISAAIILGLLTGGITIWRQVTLLEERMAYLLTLNNQQNTLFDVLKDTIRDLQKQSAMQAQMDLTIREKLVEHDKVWQDMTSRLRTVEQRYAPRGDDR